MRGSLFNRLVKGAFRLNKYMLSPMLFGIGALISSAQAEEQKFINIGTGPVTGVYHPFGQAICRSVNKSRGQHGLRCAAEAGLGSIGNIKALKSGEIGFAIVQADWLHHAFKGTAAFSGSEPLEDVRSVMKLHTEMATLVVKEDSKIHSLADLEGKRLNIGPRGSGSAASWSLISSVLQWSGQEQVHIRQDDLAGLGDALCGGSIDAYFVFIGHPAGVVEDTIAKCNVRLIGSGAEVAAALGQGAPYYVKAEIPAKLYGLQDNVMTFGTPAIFVTSKQMPDWIVETFVRSVDRDFDSFQAVHPTVGRLEQSQLAETGLGVPLHFGALNYYRERGYLPR